MPLMVRHYLITNSHLLILLHYCYNDVLMLMFSLITAQRARRTSRTAEESQRRQRQRQLRQVPIIGSVRPTIVRPAIDLPPGYGKYIYSV